MVCNTTPKRFDEEVELVFGAELGRLRVLLHDEVAIAGRGADCAIVLPHADVSHHHAELRRLGPALYQLSDLGSRNGTFVNGVQIQQATVLRLGDSIRFGEQLSARVMLHDPFQRRMQRRRRLLLLGRLISGIANELCNMAAVIFASSEHLALAVDRGDQGSAWRDDLLDMAASATRAARMTGQILAFSSGRGDEGVFDVSALCVDVAELAAHTMGDGVRVERDIAPNLHAPGCSLDLQLVVLHCLVQARATVGRRGVLRLRAARGDGTVHVSVLGARRPGAEAPSGGGAARSGIEAAISLADAGEVVREMGGSLSHQTAADGWMSRLEIPAIASAAVATTLAPRRSVGDLPAGLTVLVVDDEPAVTRGLCRLLRRAGHQAIEAENGAAALAIQRAQHPDVVLMDVRLRGEDGGLVLEKLRAIEENVRVVMMSGALHPRVRAELTGRGAAAFLAKPCNPSELMDALRAALRS